LYLGPKVWDILYFFIIFWLSNRRTRLLSLWFQWQIIRGCTRFLHWRWQLWGSRRLRGPGLLRKAGGECLTFDQLALRAPLGQNTVWILSCLESLWPVKFYLSCKSMLLICIIFTCFLIMQQLNEWVDLVFLPVFL